MTAGPKLSLAVRAEAAAWIARLHGPDRTAADEKSFRRWLAADAMHAAAFEQMTELWEAGALLKSDVLARDERTSRRRLGVRYSMAAAIVAVLLVAVAALFLPERDRAELTRVGEQRMLTLKDGSRVTLNTATRLEVSYDGAERRVNLITGEAYFEVARWPDRPFIVTAGGRQVTALGTAFVVRQESERTSVILVEGKVSVSAPEIRNEQQKSLVLTPGERVTFVPSQAPVRDRPPLSKVTAWRQGLVALDGSPLSEALAEMNRYSEVQLVAEFPADEVRVSGLFRAGDSVEFARALARTHGLRVTEAGDRIILSDARSGR